MTLQKIVNRLNDLERRLAELESREAAPAYSSLQRDGKVGMSGDQLTPANRARINYNNIYSINITEDFTSTTPAGWSWAGSPFVTPATRQIINSTWLRLSGMSGGVRSFLYKTNIANQGDFAILPVMDSTSNGMYIGVRFDDGSDNNYSEVVLRYSTSGTPYRVYYVSRVGGGTVTETEVINQAQSLFDAWLTHAISGTKWSSWFSVARLSSRNGTRLHPSSFGQTMTFTPTRVGIVVKFSNDTWHSVGVDAVNF